MCFGVSVNCSTCFFSFTEAGLRRSRILPITYIEEQDLGVATLVNTMLVERDALRDCLDFDLYLSNEIGMGELASVVNSDEQKRVIELLLYRSSLTRLNFSSVL